MKRYFWVRQKRVERSSGGSCIHVASLRTAAAWSSPLNSSSVHHRGEDGATHRAALGRVHQIVCANAADLAMVARNEFGVDWILHTNDAGFNVILSLSGRSWFRPEIHDVAVVAIARVARYLNDLNVLSHSRLVVRVARVDGI